MMSYRAVLLLPTVMAALVMSGCGILQPDKVDYKSAGRAQPLEVPPDLTRPSGSDTFVVPDSGPRGAATYSAYSKERGGSPDPTRTTVLPSPETVRMERSGNQRWLVVKGDASSVWNVVRDFWQEAGLLIDSENPAAGVMETDWAESRARIPDDSSIRAALARVLRNTSISVNSPVATAQRVKFRVRLERGAEPGVTEIFVSHRQMEEAVPSDEKGRQAVWKSKPSDPELDAEMLSRMMVRFGLKENVAKAEIAVKAAPAPLRASLVRGQDGAGTLAVNDQFDRAWRRVGLALDRVGFTVEDRDRSKGIYFVRYVDPNAGDKAQQSKGFFAWLNPFSRSDSKQASISTSDQFRIQVKDGDSVCQVSVLGRDGGLEKSDTASRILALLYDQLK